MFIHRTKKETGKNVACKMNFIWKERLGSKQGGNDIFEELKSDGVLFIVEEE